nr:MAG TPA: hypothetical protein [Caudoviricetes sp.]
MARARFWRGVKSEKAWFMLKREVMLDGTETDIHIGRGNAGEDRCVF